MRVHKEWGLTPCPFENYCKFSILYFWNSFKRVYFFASNRRLSSIGDLVFSCQISSLYKKRAKKRTSFSIFCKACKSLQLLLLAHKKLNLKRLDTHRIYKSKWWVKIHLTIKWTRQILQITKKKSLKWY